MSDVPADPTPGQSPGVSPGIPADLTWIRAAPPGATGPGPWIEIAFGADEGVAEGEEDGEAPVYLRETSAPENVVTTNRRKWEAFALGVRAGEFDHFVQDVDLNP
ncbi:DUF397 domain-containing protein [Streptomyces sp. NPDC091281]|uniref:DUF397 domain-containing protein n=1 Tax=Streptomyces sp. NPDC091281 TaxID=3365985 RepID=UPI0037FEFDFC